MNLKKSNNYKEGVSFSDFEIYSLIGKGNSANIYVANYNANNVLKITPQGAVSVLVEKLDKPYGLHVNGNMLFITCQGSNSVFRQKI